MLDAMLPYWTDQYGNPHSRTHYFGWESDDAVEAARKQVQLCSVSSQCSLCSHFRRWEPLVPGNTIAG